VCRNCTDSAFNASLFPGRLCAVSELCDCLWSAKIFPEVIHATAFSFFCCGVVGGCFPSLLRNGVATVHGVVHDAQHRPIAGAEVTLQAADSDFVLHAETDATGAFEMAQTPIGVYRLSVAHEGFATATQTLSVASGTNPVLHIPLAVGGGQGIRGGGRVGEHGRYGDTEHADYAGDDRGDSGGEPDDGNGDD